MNYLYVIAGNLCKNVLRSRREIAFSQLGADSVQGVLPESGISVWKMDLEQAVQQMPGELREVVILYYFQELKLREIAGILGIGLPLVKYRMKKAKEHLKSVLGEDYL